MRVDPSIPSGTAPDYDYIIAGAGAAGLSLLVRMIRSGSFAGKKILLVDRDRKNRNDRTWCFWETGEGLFDHIVWKRWPRLWFHGSGYSGRFDTAPYQYKMIRGIDFYEYCLGIIRQQPNISIQYGNVTAMHSAGAQTWLELDSVRITAGYIFNSIVFGSPPAHKGQYHLLQHFKGWIIETPRPAFDPQEATLMDFRVGQQHGTAFVYVMPFSSTRALVEYTLFTPALLEPEAYDKGLREYIENRIKPCSFSIVEEEFGQIPMTNYRFPVREGNILYIGTAGGQTKASSGYTFQFIQKRTAAIVQGLVAGRLPAATDKLKYRFYDSVFLNVLATGKLPGSTVFTHLFRKNPPGRIFRFLDNESSLLEDLMLISTLPTLPFLKAGVQQAAHC